MTETKVSYVGDGAARDFTVPFPYLLRTHISVTVDGTAATVTWPTAATVRLASAPANGASIVIERVSTGGGALVDFNDASVLGEVELNLASRQALYISEEARSLSEEAMEARGIARKIAKESDAILAAANTAVSTAETRAQKAIDLANARAQKAIDLANARAQDAIEAANSGSASAIALANQAIANADAGASSALAAAIKATNQAIAAAEAGAAAATATANDAVNIANAASTTSNNAATNANTAAASASSIANAARDAAAASASAAATALSEAKAARVDVGGALQAAQGAQAAAEAALAASDASSRVMRSGDTMTGPLAVRMATPSLALENSGPNGASSIYGRTGTSNRNAIDIVSAHPQTGGNAGGNVAWHRYDDNAAFMGTSLILHRASGKTESIEGFVSNATATEPAHIPNKSQMDTAVAAKVSKTGDVLTGDFDIQPGGSIQFHHANEGDADGMIAVGVHDAGLNIVGSRTAGDGVRRITSWGRWQNYGDFYADRGDFAYYTRVWGPTNAELYLDKKAGSGVNRMFGRSAGTPQWHMDLGDGNGSFSLGRYYGGVYQGSAIWAEPANGIIQTQNTIASGGNLVSRATGAEGGKIVLGYTGNTTATGQGAATWNLDVGSDNTLRLFRQDADNSVVNVLDASRADGRVAFKHPIIQQSTDWGMLFPNGQTDGSGNVWHRYHAGQASTGRDIAAAALHVPGQFYTYRLICGDYTWDFRNDGSIRSTGPLYAPVLRGGPGDAGHLRLFEGSDYIGFRNEGGYLQYRINNTFQQNVMVSPNLRYADARDWSGTWSMLVQQSDGANIVFFPSAYSDARLKENIQPTSVDALAKLKALRVVSFDWNADGVRMQRVSGSRVSKPVGLIAQDLVEQGITEAVVEAPNMAPTTGEDDATRLMLKSDELIPYLIRSIQQLEGRLAALEA